MRSVFFVVWFVQVMSVFIVLASYRVEAQLIENIIIRVAIFLAILNHGLYSRFMKELGKK